MSRESPYSVHGLQLGGVMLLIAMQAACTSSPERQTINELFAEALNESRVRHDDPAEAAVREADGATTAVEPIPEKDPRPPLAQLADPESPRVDDIFIDTDLRQALNALAAQAEVSLTFDPRVQGQASAIIEDEPFEVALQKLLLPLGYVYHKQDERTYLIGVPDPESPLFPLMAKREVHRPRHVTPEELKAQMPERYLPFLRADDKHNRIVVEAHPALADRILWELRQNDEALPQVVLEAIVCVLAPDDRFRFGFDFQQGLDIGDGDFLNMAMNNLDLSGDLGPAEMETIRSFQFTSVFLRALAQEGYLAIRAAPRVMARSGEKAEINIGRETFFGIQPEQNFDRILRQEIREIESGIMLDIRPVVRGSNIVVHIERAEVSEDLRTGNAGNNNSTDRFPIVNRRRVSTTVDLEDGETIVIGGLVQRRQMDQVDRVPILGDLPGIGTLFQQIDKQDEEAEVAIFISARIVGNNHDR